MGNANLLESSTNSRFSLSFSSPTLEGVFSERDDAVFDETSDEFWHHWHLSHCL